MLGKVGLSEIVGVAGCGPAGEPSLPSRQPITAIRPFVITGGSPREEAQPGKCLIKSGDKQFVGVSLRDRRCEAAPHQTAEVV